jgi:hypothetical protein
MHRPNVNLGDSGGAGLVLGPGIDPVERLSFTRGVVSACGRVVDGVPYRSDAIVPAPHWRPATPEQVAGLGGERSHARRHDGVTVAIVRPGEALLEALAPLGFASARTLEECTSKLRGRAYLESLQRALPCLADFLTSEDGVQLLGTCVQRGGLVSTTTHADDQGQVTFSGLHVDEWDGLALGERHRCRRQMSINLGAGDRFFIFASTPVDAIAREFGDHFDRGTYVGIGATLFAHRPDEVLYRVRVRPGEAYIAPTDNLVHDGSTAGRTAPDVTLNLRGYFGVP